MKKGEKKEAQVKELEPVVEAPQEQEVQNLVLSADDANAYLQIINLIMVKDDRSKALQTHFVEMLKRNNEGLNEQPS